MSLIKNNRKAKHFLDIASLSINDINDLLALTESFVNQQKPSCILQNQYIVNLFYEPSTRTRVSFEIAAKQLGAHVINIDSNFSSATKGEGLLDTFKTIEATGCKVIVLRHPDNGAAHLLASNCNANTVIVNAGDGTNNHPSQALLDLYTIKQQKKILHDLKIVIAGDVKHSRVANSFMQLLAKVGVGSLHVVAPSELQPENVQKISEVSFEDNFDHAINNADIVYMLRVQRERLEQPLSLPKKDYFSYFGLTLERVKLAKPDCLIMHPGPFNRGVEISDDIINHPRSAIFTQVRNGVLARKAIFSWLLAEH